MARCEDSVINDLMEIIDGYHGTDYYVMLEIPQKKLAASTAFHGVDPRDTVLVLLDSTVMGSAENGMSITLKGVYWKNMWAVKTRKNRYSWEELTKIINQIEFSGGHLCFEPGVVFSTPANYKGEGLVNLLKSICRYFIEVNSVGKFAESPTKEVDITPPSTPLAAIAAPMGLSDYHSTLINSMALLIANNGTCDQNCLDMALEFLNVEDGIDLSLAIEKLTSILQVIETESVKSMAFLKLRQSKIIAECKPLTGVQKDQLVIILDAIREAASVEAQQTIDGIIGKIFKMV